MRGRQAGRGAGYTLIEILVVLSILGILLGLGGFEGLKSYRASQLNRSVQDFVAQVDQARAQARRTNRCFRLTVTGGTTGAYKIEQYKTSTCTGAASDIDSTRTYDAGSGTRMTVTSPSATNTDEADFRPPYGINAAGLPIDLQVEHLGSAALKKELRVTGVMGTVVAQ